MSDIIEDGEELLDESVESTDDAAASAVGLTSEEADEKKSILSSFTILDAMLLISLLCVTLATLSLFFELRTFGDFPSEFPWRADEFKVQ